MIIVKKNFKQGKVRIRISLLDDLWYLSHIIQPRDLITSKTERKIKLGDAANGRTQVVRKTILLQLEVLDVVLEEGGILRVKGIVSKGTDDVPLGAHHSFNLSLNDEFQLEKNTWPKYLKEKLDEAANNTAQDLLLVLFDREEALFAQVTQQGIHELAHIKGEVQNKQYKTKASGSILQDIVQELKQQQERLKTKTIILGSPSFWHAPLKKLLPQDLQKSCTLITAHGVERAAMNKLLSRPELQSLVSKQRVSKEQGVVEAMLAALAKEKLAYSLGDVAEAAAQGAIDALAITDTLIQKARSEGTYEKVDEVLQTVDSANGKVHILYDESTMKTIDGLGGIVGSRRW